MYQIDPKHLDCFERRVIENGTSTNEGKNDGNDVHSELKLQKFRDGVID
jgi:hypothetical protein